MREQARARRLLAALALLPLAAACLIDPYGSRQSQRELNASRQRWESHQIDDYQYVVEIGCFCPPEVIQPAVVVVRDDTVASVTYVADSQPAPDWAAERFPTVDGLFDVIQQAINREAVELQVSYDRTYSYPRTISVDFRRNTADDETAYRARDLQPLNGRF